MLTYPESADTLPAGSPSQPFSIFRRKQNVTKLQQLKAMILDDGVIEEAEVEIIRRELYADGQIDRAEVEFLIAVRNEAEGTCPAFEALFFKALKQNVLADGTVDADEAAWLREMLFADGKIDAHEKQFLRDLKAGAKSVSPEFQTLFDECMRN
jgi:hypothetical protein